MTVCRISSLVICGPLTLLANPSSLSGILTAAGIRVKEPTHGSSAGSGRRRHYVPHDIGELLPGCRVVAAAYGDAVPSHVLAELPALERKLARTVGSARVPSFVAGRIALHHALAAVGARASLGISIKSSGAPRVPRRFVGSIAHSHGIAVAIAGRDKGRSLGIDIEGFDLMHGQLATRVLAREELRVLARMPLGDANVELIVKFSMKEAAFKAIGGLGGRELSYQRLRVLGTYAGRTGLRRANLRGAGAFAAADLRGRILMTESQVIAVCSAVHPRRALI